MTLSPVEAQELRQLLGHVSFELTHLMNINRALQDAGFNYDYPGDTLHGDIDPKK